MTSFDEFLSTFCDAGITIHSVNRRDWVIKSNDDSLEKNAKLIPRSIYVYIYIQNHKRPRHHPESSGYFNQKKVDCATRDHTFNHPFEQTASICTRNPSRWNTSRSRSSRGTLFVINSLQLTSFAPMEFTVLGDRPERERGGGRLSWWRSGTRNLSPSPSIFLFVPRPGEMPSQPASQSPTGREKWSKNFLEIDRTRLLRVSGHGWYTHHPSCRG